MAFTFNQDTRFKVTCDKHEACLSSISKGLSYKSKGKIIEIVLYYHKKKRNVL